MRCPGVVAPGVCGEGESDPAGSAVWTYYHTIPRVYSPPGIIRAMKLKQLGEFELIEKMARVFRREPVVTGADHLRRLVLGIGDDAAVWRMEPGHAIATVDAMVEGVHFTRETTGWYDLGWKAMVSNLSDVASMGGRPTYALAVLAATGEEELDEVLEVCRGMADAAEHYGAIVVGGDTVSSSVLTLSITMMGETASDPGSPGAALVLSRYAARPGDQVAVTGVLGSSAGGLDLLLRGGAASPEAQPLIEAHRRPLPRIREGQLLLDAGVRCAMDLSDGLAGDLARICRASEVGARVDLHRLPVHTALVAAFGERATDLAASGGEDYELLCTGPADTLARARLLLEGAGTPLTTVGEIVQQVPGEPAILARDPTGRTGPLGRSGWEHFTSR